MTKCNDGWVIVSHVVALWCISVWWIVLLESSLHDFAVQFVTICWRLPVAGCYIVFVHVVVAHAKCPRDVLVSCQISPSETSLTDILKTISGHVMYPVLRWASFGNVNSSSFVIDDLTADVAHSHICFSCTASLVRRTCVFLTDCWRLRIRVFSMVLSRCHSCGFCEFSLVCHRCVLYILLLYRVHQKFTPSKQHHIINY